MKRIFINVLLVLISVLVGYGLLELGFRVAMSNIPKALMNYQCRELRVIGQSSFKEVAPSSSYIAIMGDSYAAGQGDWFAENRYDPNSRYQATHVLNDLTGLDVVSFGRAGAGNYDGTALHAINTYRYLNKVGFNYPEPSYAIVYFYEGNDISDNGVFYKRYYLPHYDASRLYDDEYFELFADDMEQKYAQGNLRELESRFYVANMISRSLEGMIYSATKKRKDRIPGTQYRFVMDGKESFLPEPLKVRLEDYSEKKVKQAIRFFERSLHRLAQEWPNSRKFVVYVPCALTTYAVQGENAAKRLARSQEIADMVNVAAKTNGYTFLDFATSLRESARFEYVHGPKDWGHFNRRGYTLLGEFLNSSISFFK